MWGTCVASATHIRNTHAEHQRIHEIADDDIATLHAIGGEPVVGMQRMMVHGDHAKQMIVGFGDGLTRPMAVNIADNKILEASPERSLVNGHGLGRYSLSSSPAE
jgi:hypothetical protein